ncbi:MAG: asparagine synthase (glutamine-hydrolyzing) [Deltaproteobacteria bacterium]|nr:asparagine synthase (glutamine-hydrolyzing) [Deltaproteobacteria bacterium]
MCGICGAFSLGPPLDDRDREEVRGMTRVLRHRGPDQEGILVREGFALGSTRLKIIDLDDHAGMPMSSEDGAIWITYNGEVTNFRELRRRHRLDERHRFRTSSDTEVLLHLYEELGIAFVQELTGMFAFCLVDTARGRAWVVRDFYGIRPLFFMAAADRLYFASEIKAFLGLDRFRDDVDPEAIFHFFSLAYIPDRLTPFVHVRELPGGWLLEVDLVSRSFRERAYHAIEYRPDRTLDVPTATRRLREGMIDAVERNLVSDAPLGMTLSGGFDTSSMLSVIRFLGRSRDLHTFSIRIDEPSFDESRWQHLMASWAGTRHHEVVVGPGDVLETFERHMAFMDEPSGDGAAIPTWLLARDARSHVSVLLSGEGGDEVFNAYETHLAWKVRGLYREKVPRPVRDLVRRVASRLPRDYRKLSFDFLARRFTEGAELDVPDAHFYWRHSLSPEEKAALMPGLPAYRRTETFFSDLYDSLGWEEELNRLSLVDIRYFFIGDLMVKNDRMMMAHSIEARFPWMDRLLVETASSIPPEFRIRGLTRRWLQKQAMRDLVPAAIYRRNNMGLEMPHSLWFLSALRPLAGRWLRRDVVERTGLLSFDAVERLWGEHLARRKDHGRSLWCILNFLCWHELFVHGKTWRAYVP